MARRHSAFRARLVASGRKTFWLAGSIVKTTLASAGSAAIVTSLNAAAIAMAPFTIVRSRGWFSFMSDQNSADEDQQVHYGEILVSEQALAVGISAVPTPRDDNGSSWHVYESAAQAINVGSDIGIHPNFMPTRYSFDSKAMRKFEEGQQLIQVIQNDTSDGAIVLTYSRVLIKLH